MVTSIQQKKIYLLLACISILSIGCTNEEPTLKDNNNMASFDLVDFFSGKTQGSGFVQDRSGKIIRSFEVITIGNFVDGSGTLQETFTWNDGEIEERIWTLNSEENDKWSGEASDVIGTAEGEVIGDTLRWSYTLVLKVGSKKINFKFDDQMWLSESGVMVNHAKFSKFGIHLGDVVVSFNKQ
ncbi:MAG: DUF3833 family protein [Burkholderiales bacterium]|nr:DUF3833 family protein [Burkholderiales bacterium]